MATESTSKAALAEVEALVRETFALWDVVRVGFSWRNYYLNHTYRIRNLSVQMAAAEGGDADLLEMAAILHDITKRYDGNILTGPDGKRVLDEEGFWRNEMIMPDRSNWVTELYDELELQGLIHHVSGAVITDRVLGEYGFEAPYRDNPVTEEPHLLQTYRYVALNPVRARLCSTPEDWPWASYRATAGIEPAPPFLRIDRVRGFFAWSESDGTAEFQQFVCAGLTSLNLAAAAYSNGR